MEKILLQSTIYLHSNTHLSESPSSQVANSLTSELTISSGTLCTMETVAVEMGTCCFPFLLCSLEGRKKKRKCIFRTI